MKKTFIFALALTLIAPHISSMNIKKRKLTGAKLAKDFSNHTSAAHFAIEKKLYDVLQDLFNPADLSGKSARILLKAGSHDGGNLFHYAASDLKAFLVLIDCASRFDMSTQDIERTINTFDHSGITAGTWLFKLNNKKEIQKELNRIKKEENIKLKFSTVGTTNIFGHNKVIECECVCAQCKIEKIEKSKIHPSKKLDKIINTLRNAVKDVAKK